MALLWIRTFLYIWLIEKLTLSMQHEYTITYEALKLTDYNTQYFDDPKVTLFWYNRTTKAFNASSYLKQDLDVEMQVNVTVYKFINNRFRYYPVQFKKNFCDFLDKNLFGIQDIAKVANVTECPIFKGFYNLPNVLPDVEKFPQYLIPNGRYRIFASTYNHGDYLGTALWQGEVQPARFHISLP